MSLKSMLANRINQFYQPVVKLKVDTIKMLPGDRMVRAGGGQNKFRNFFRIDLWKKGYRVTSR